MSEDKSILLRAEEIVNGARAKDYGDPFENWSTTVGIFEAMTGVKLAPAQGVQFAIAMKLARLRTSPTHEDTILDLAGYAWVYDQVRKGAEKIVLTVTTARHASDDPTIQVSRAVSGGVEFKTGTKVRRANHQNNDIPAGCVGVVTAANAYGVHVRWLDAKSEMSYPLTVAYLFLNPAEA